MADLEKTIQGLEICIENIDKVECPEECPYYEKCMAYDRRSVFQPLLRDTLAILKAQQERIKELEELLHEGGCDGINACDVKACPYYNASHVRLEETKDEKIRELQEEIHTLEAAQQPRVMALEEVRRCGYHVFIELKDKNGAETIGSTDPEDLKEFKSLYSAFWHLHWRRGNVMLEEFYLGIPSNRDYKETDKYNATWRCWDKLPPDQLMEATPWQS